MPTNNWAAKKDCSVKLMRRILLLLLLLLLSSLASCARPMPRAVTVQGSRVYLPVTLVHGYQWPVRGFGHPPEAWGIRAGATSRTMPEVEACTADDRLPSAPPMRWPFRTRSPGWTSGRGCPPTAWWSGMTSRSGRGTRPRGVAVDLSL